GDASDVLVHVGCELRDFVADASEFEFGRNGPFELGLGPFPRSANTARPHAVDHGEDSHRPADEEHKLLNHEVTPSVSQGGRAAPIRPAWTEEIANQGVLRRRGKSILQKFQLFRFAVDGVFIPRSIKGPRGRRFRRTPGSRSMYNEKAIST